MVKWTELGVSLAVGASFLVGSLPAFAQGPEKSLAPGQGLDLPLIFDGDQNRATVSACTGSPEDLNRLDGAIYAPNRVDPVGRLTQSAKDVKNDINCKTWTGGNEYEGDWRLRISNVGNVTAAFDLQVLGFSFVPGSGEVAPSLTTTRRATCPPCPPGSRYCSKRPCRIF